jgi:hypothetical protein
MEEISDGFHGVFPSQTTKRTANDLDVTMPIFDNSITYPTRADRTDNSLTTGLRSSDNYTPLHITVGSLPTPPKIGDLAGLAAVCLVGEYLHSGAADPGEDFLPGSLKVPITSEEAHELSPLLSSHSDGDLDVFIVRQFVKLLRTAVEGSLELVPVSLTGLGLL